MRLRLRLRAATTSSSKCGLVNAVSAFQRLRVFRVSAGIIIIKAAHIWCSRWYVINNCDCLSAALHFPMHFCSCGYGFFSHDRLSQLYGVFCVRNPHPSPLAIIVTISFIRFWLLTAAILKVPLTRDLNNWINLIKRSAVWYFVCFTFTFVRSISLTLNLVRCCCRLVKCRAL